MEKYCYLCKRVSNLRIYKRGYEMSEIDSSRIFTRQQVDDLLTAAINKTLLQVDNAKLFAHHEGRISRGRTR